MTEQYGTDGGERARREAARKIRKQKIIRRRITALICAGVLVVAAGFGLSRLLGGGDDGEGDGSGGGGIFGSAEPKAEPVELTISCVGDVMAHQSQLTAQYDSATKSYNFDDNFQYVKKYIEGADLALCNVETTFAGGAYTGYPSFNAPETLADALKNAGFDVAITANNHMMDKGFSGMQRTVEVLRAAGLPVTGSRLTGETQKYVMQEVNGVQVAVVAYTYETPGVNGRRTINGNPLSDEAKSAINSFSYNSLDNDLADVQATISAAREAGAQIVTVYFHWGEEYQRTPNDWQQTIARRAAEMGADLIFASHPHVLQGVEMLEIPADVPADASAGGDEDDNGADSGGQTQDPAVRRVPVFYSMGNFISNQRTETLGDTMNKKYTEQGMIANVHITYDKTAGKITDISMDAMPTWVDKYNSGGKVNYAIVPLDSAMADNAALKTSGHLSRAQDALSDVKKLLGEEYVAQ
ncbi:CapA family protein [Bacilliculturomica massiliensis]|uniref:CapA family protein n=1 Tax=Bacilliculturomica massiliensis TaxID=1917867 RepID=UPI0010310B00|nr:CapA family protein [Bacilliculturomica massiliensis]